MICVLYVEHKSQGIKPRYQLPGVNINWEQGRRRRQPDGSAAASRQQDPAPCALPELLSLFLLAGHFLLPTFVEGT